MVMTRRASLLERQRSESVVVIEEPEAKPEVERKPLSEIPATLGEWRQKGDEIHFDGQTETVLRASDYTMREYTTTDGRLANLYIGYYASQRTGATYHSPQNCLPGAGWVMKQPELVEIKTASGESFPANKFIIENGIYNEVMVYWYQGRGRSVASEYHDKIYTVLDSVLRRRSDGAVSGLRHQLPELALLGHERLVNGQRRDRAARGGADAELGAGADVAGGEDVVDRRVVRVVDHDVAVLTAVAAELRAEVVGRVLADGEEDLLAA